MRSVCIDFVARASRNACGWEDTSVRHAANEYHHDDLSGMSHSHATINAQANWILLFILFLTTRFDLDSRPDPNFDCLIAKLYSQEQQLAPDTIDAEALMEHKRKYQEHVQKIRQDARQVPRRIAAA